MAVITRLSQTGFYELITEHAEAGESWLLFLDLVSEAIRVHVHALGWILNLDTQHSVKYDCWRDAPAHIFSQ